MNTSIKIILGFLIFGITWICLTDIALLYYFKTNVKLYYEIQTVKGIIFVLLAAGLIYFISRRLQNSIVNGNSDLTQKNQQLSRLSEERVNYQKKIAQAIINVQEAERKMLGEALHDNITQILATTKLYLGLALEKPGVNEELLKKSTNNILEAIRELRNLCKSLTPSSLEDLGLIPSIEDLAHTFMQSKEILVEIKHAEFDEQGVNKDKKTVLYRIIQEQLNNIVRYTNAKSVTISMKSRENNICLSVWNNGRFKDANDASHNIGMENIRNRVELFNGSMNISHSSASGATLQVEV